MRLKDKQRQRRRQRSLVWLVLAAGVTRGWAQYADWGLEREDPLWSEFVPQLRYLKMDVEAEQNSYTFNGSGNNKLENQRLYFSPGMGIGWNNFLYHPDLFTFSLLAEPSYVWQQVNGTGYANNQETILLNGLFTGMLLREKPYATTISYASSHDDVHYDFFNSATSDTETWGVVTGYHEGPVPVVLTFQKSNTDTVGFSQETVTDQINVNLHARNERKKQDATDLNYQFSQLNYDTHYQLASFSTENSYQQVSLTDSEHFEKSTLNSMFRYYDLASSHSASQNLNASVGYNLEHTPHLHSFYNYSFSDYSGNGSDSIENYATAGLGHQLYESLASSVNIHGSMLNSSSFGSTLDSVTYGAGGSVDYAKRLGDWARLSLGNGVGYDVTDQQVSGSELFIADESYNVPTTGPMIIRLKSPRAISVSSVKKNNVDLSPGEYTVVQTSDPWQIQFFSGGPNNVQPGDAITVSYTVLSNPSGSYSVFTDNAHISLRFWREQAEIYASYNFTDNQANSAGFLLQNVQQFEAGARLDWRGFRAQASYTDQHSTLYSYQSLTLSEGYSTPVSLHSTVGIDLSQQWSIYPPGSGTSTNQTQTATFYNYMVHYEWRPTSELNWHVEVGYQQQAGIGYDQNLFAVRTYLNWLVGKLEFRLGYEHDNQQYTLEARERDLVFLRMRRNF
jgi:hypothetical protein